MERNVTVVAGVPRSGTSLLMQMLDAGGHPVLVDDERPPDAHNPRGYFEFAPAKALDRDASWLPRAEDERIEEVFSDPTAKRGITHTQLQAVTDMINDPWQNLPAARKEKLQELRKQLMDDFFPEDDGRSWAGIEA